MEKPLHEILKGKRDRSGATTEELGTRRDEWLKRIRALYEQLAAWLSPSVKAELVTVSYPAVPLEEEPLGRYQAEAMWITFYNGQVIKLVPIGLNVIGANGRVDMDLGDRQVSFLGEPDGSGWIVVESFPALSGAGWISKRHLEMLRGSRPHKLPLSKEVFEDLLKDYVEKF